MSNEFTTFLWAKILYTQNIADQLKKRSRWQWTELAPMSASRPRWTESSMCATYPTRSLRRRCEWLYFTVCLKLMLALTGSLAGMTSLGNTVLSGRSEWGTLLKPEEQLLSSTRTSLTPRMLAITSLDSMCATGAIGKSKPEIKFSAQVSGCAVLPGKQSLWKAGRSEKGGRPAEDEGEIQPEHPCPLICPDLNLCFVFVLFILRALKCWSVLLHLFELYFEK